MPGWAPLPTGEGATPLLKELRAMNAQIYGTIFAGAGVISGDVTVEGTFIGNDYLSSNWDGAIPVNLSSSDGTATVGFAWDASLGAAQLMGNLFLGGDFEFIANGVFRTAASGQRIEMTNTDRNRIRFYSGDVLEEVSGTISQGTNGTGVTRTLQFALATPQIDVDDLMAALVIRSGSPDGTSTAPGIVISQVATGGADTGMPLEFRIQSGIPLITDGLIQTAWGSAGNPPHTFTSALTSGMYLYSTDRVGFSTAGSVRLTVAADYTRFGNQVTAGNAAIATVVGSAGAPTFTFTSDANTGMWWPNADQLELVVGGARSILMRAAGVFIPQAYTQTNPAAANVFVYSNGQLARSTSSLKYKKGWSYAVGLADQALPAPIAWTDEAGQDRIGWGAEHVAETFPEAREHENYDLRSIVAVLSAKVLRSEAKIVKLERLVKEITGGIHK